MNDVHVVEEEKFGAEIHVQLNKSGKAFTASPIQLSSEPNQNADIIDLGFPGTLPLINTDVIQKAFVLSKALRCRISESLVFDRKHYFYPDLSKGFQITQHKNPFSTAGEMKYRSDNNKIKVARIKQIHLEEDSGKSNHSGKYTYLDYNRAGIALLEIVTEPGFQNPTDLIAFLIEMVTNIQFLNISDGLLEKGHIRFDINHSIRFAEGKFLFSEIKNLNSYSAVEEAVKFNSEFLKHFQVGNIASDKITFGYDVVNKSFYQMRKKPTPEEYCYMHEPDIKTINLKDKAEYKDINHDILPVDLFVELKAAGIHSEQINLITRNTNLSLLFIRLKKKTDDFKSLCNLLSTSIYNYIQKYPGSSKRLVDKTEQFLDILVLIREDKIDHNNAPLTIIEELLQSKEQNVFRIAEEKKLLFDKIDQILIETIQQLLRLNIDKVKMYKEGKTAMINYFIGQVMRKSAKYYDPVEIKDIIVKEINKFAVH